MAATPLASFSADFYEPYVISAKAENNSQATTMTIALDNYGPVDGLEFVLALPEGVEESAVTVTSRAQGMTAQVSQKASGAWLFMLYPAAVGAVIETGSGDIAAITFTPAMEAGATISISDAVIGRGGSDVTPPTGVVAAATISVGQGEEPIEPEPEPGMRGDVNLDGKEDVADVTTLVDIILGRETNPDKIAAANIDNTGNIDVGDVTTLVDIILGRKK
ncbi:MAG: dockerin type I repeat-containing protein [Pseudoflavonifractor sp.]|nr:dockerin type I repeat-containing protein [Alloprevotella sp.]MCM1116286.1 dockerin type I repeat-containing protein [Pseudoflavonifractor sp.]